MNPERVAVEVDGVWPDDTDEDEGVIIDWYVREGTPVEPNQTLCTIQIEKVDIDVPASVAGVLVEIELGEDDTVVRGDTLAWIELK